VKALKKREMRFLIVEAAIYKLSVLGLCLSFAIILGAAETLGLIQKGPFRGGVSCKNRSFYI